MNTTPTLKAPEQLVSEAKGDVLTCTPREAVARIRQDDPIAIVDVRGSAEYAEAHLDTALNIPRGLLEWKIIGALPEATAPILIHCGTGGRAVLSARSLMAMGYTNVAAIDGSFSEITECMAENQALTRTEFTE
ncbi:rhodanese-like domain-containing protein [Zhongshania sp.]|jgi:rhodanese-related sulfurtransferase|uniref:rhodanese-like domain-containing protein n=1 Tax=Zhongshania sp. TaxID=1971902 RepID=UPI002A7F01DA|nr:rhodanese-like domain-containing protein [Zhongshania sp.]